MHAFAQSSVSEGDVPPQKSCRAEKGKHEPQNAVHGERLCDRTGLTQLSHNCQRLYVEGLSRCEITLQLRNEAEAQQRPGHILVLLQLAKQSFGFTQLRHG